jgi:hypothetical protein
MVAEALTSDVATGLARFAYLRLIGRSPAVRSGTAPERYAVEGEVRMSGSAVRINARLVDVATGVHWWAETYSREASTDAFALVDDVGSRIVATIADGNGALLRAFASTPLEARDTAVMTLLLRFFAYTQHFTAPDHAWLREALAALAHQEPGNSRAWAYLAMLHVHEVLFGFNPMPDAEHRAQQAADLALSTDATNQSGWVARALAAFVNRDLTAFRAAADRAIELNPLSTLSVGTMGLHLAYSGDMARGTALVRRAMALNPNHPGWYHIALFLDAYGRGDGDAAMMHAKRITMPHIPTAALLPIAAAGRFDRTADARAGIEELSKHHAELLETGTARATLGRWFWDGPLLDSVLEGVERARALARA